MKEEWTSMRSLADARSIIKKADKGPCVVVWDKWLYGLSWKTPRIKNIHKDVNFSDKTLRDLVDKSNKTFRSFTSQGKINEKELKYFTYDVKSYWFR